MQVFTVAELATYVKSVLAQEPVLSDVWVNGEVSNLFKSANGHAYFTLKEGTKAALRCALFKGNRGTELLHNGDAVNAHGRVSFYEARGDLQIYVDMVQPAGLGALALELERLKAELEEQGLFDPSRKRPLPRFPQRIGVATSEQGAVFHDICTVIERRYPLAEIVLCPTAVQGNEAVSEVVDSIRTLNAEGNIDVIIVGRGGGSLEDLSAFNSAAVAHAIHASHVPVVSAVGHETDFTIADLVADYRAPTPSAAAESVTPNRTVLTEDIRYLIQRSHTTVSHLLAQQSQAVEALAHRTARQLPDVTDLRQRVDDLMEQGKNAMLTLLERRHDQTNSLRSQLESLSPLGVLSRGYSVLTHLTTGGTITSIRQVAPGDSIRATLNDGLFDAKVVE
jgi:exodeoxyribonuclease VII large subunit